MGTLQYIFLHRDTPVDSFWIFLWIPPAKSIRLAEFVGPVKDKEPFWMYWMIQFGSGPVKTIFFTVIVPITAISALSESYAIFFKAHIPILICEFILNKDLKFLFFRTLVPVKPRTGKFYCHNWHSHLYSLLRMDMHCNIVVELGCNQLNSSHPHCNEMNNPHDQADKFQYNDHSVQEL